MKKYCFLSLLLAVCSPTVAETKSKPEKFPTYVQGVYSSNQQKWKFTLLYIRRSSARANKQFKSKFKINRSLAIREFRTSIHSYQNELKNTFGFARFNKTDALLAAFLTAELKVCDAYAALGESGLPDTNVINAESEAAKRRHTFTVELKRATYDPNDGWHVEQLLRD